MPLDPEGVVEFDCGDEKYRLYFGIRAEKAAELHYDLPFFRILQRTMPQLSPEDMGDQAKIAEASASVRFTDVAKLFEFGLLKYQPEIEETQVDDIIDSIGLKRTTELLGQAIAAAMVDEGGDGAKQNPPKASPKKKTGSPALQTG